MSPPGKAGFTCSNSENQFRKTEEKGYEEQFPVLPG
jgi:hypothetical protein